MTREPEIILRALEFAGKQLKNQEFRDNKNTPLIKV